MSGSFEELDVPPTLISFAVAVGNMKRATSPEFKDAGHRVVRIAPRYQADGLTPDKDALLEVFSASRGAHRFRRCAGRLHARLRRAPPRLSSR